MALAQAELAEWQLTGRRLLVETDHMEALIGDLLFLAQTAAPHLVETQPLDLEDVVAEEVARLPRDGSVKVTLRASGSPVRGNRQQLSRMVRNLLLNAAEFAVGRVGIEVSQEAETAVLVVEDDGPGVPEDHREDIFDRFVTLDQARDRRSGGTGLGLAIARSVAEAHGGAIALEGPAPTSRFVVRLPAL